MSIEERKKNSVFGIIFGVLISIPIISIIHVFSYEGDIIKTREVTEPGNVGKYITSRIAGVDFLRDNGTSIRILLYPKKGGNFDFSKIEQLLTKRVCATYTEEIYENGSIKYILSKISEGECNNE